MYKCEAVVVCEETSGGARVKRVLGHGGAKHNSDGANFSDKN